MPGLTAEEEADDGTSDAKSLGCASQQDSRKGARGGREEASKVACPDREEGASKAQATEEDLARQVDKSSTGRSPGAADPYSRILAMCSGVAPAAIRAAASCQSTLDRAISSAFSKLRRAN